MEKSLKLKQEFHRRCCSLFLSYCKEFYESKQKEILALKFITIEPNVWACLERLLHSKEQSLVKHLGARRYELLS